MSVLVVDGGQSGIRARLDASPRIVEVDGVSRLEGDVAAVVAERVTEAWRRLGAPAVERVGLGLTTASPDGADRLLDLVIEATGAGRAWLADDTVTTHAGALGGSWGVALAVGTGVACLAVPEEGEPTIVDGHGYLLGDDGAAFWIGREAVRAVLRSAEGRDPATALTEGVARQLGGIDGLAVRIHEAPRAVSTIAAVAPLVSELADADAVAASILDRAADALAETVTVAAAACGRDRSVPVALTGGALDAPALRARLERRIAERIAAATLVPVRGGPLDGALLIDADPGRYRSLISRSGKDHRDV